MSEVGGGATRTVLITGASHGLGLEVARELAQQGMTVVLTARNLEKARDAAKELEGEGLSVHPRVLDVDDDESVRALAAELGREFGGLDVLINNAAAFADWSEEASSADLAVAKEVLNTNLFGAWRVTQGVLPLIREGGHGRIVNVASGAGSHGEPRFGLATGGSAATYGISKAALNALTSKLAAELKDTGILVNSVDPGLTATAPGMEEMGARPILEGAASVAWAATLPDDGPTGGFFRDGEPLPW